MADKKSDKNKTATAEPRKKADVILEKIDCLLSSSNEMVNRVDKSVASTNYISRQNSEIYERTLEENANIRQQIKYIAAQNQNVYDKMSAMISDLSEKVGALQQVVEAQANALQQVIETQTNALQQVVETRTGAISQSIESEAGGIKQAIENARGENSELAASVDCEAIAEAVAARIDLDELAKDVSDKISVAVEEEEVSEAEPVLYEAEEIPADEAGEDEPYGIDYDLIADKVAERLFRSVVRTDDEGETTMGDVKEEISADYIASRVAEQLQIPEPDYDAIADAVFERFYQDDETETEEDDGLEEEVDGSVVEEEYVPTDDELEQFAADENALPEYEPVDYEKIASLVVEKLVQNDEEYTEPDIEPYDVEKFTNLVFDYEKLADLISERVFRDDGQGEEIEEDETFEFDYDKLAEAIVAKGGVVVNGAEVDEASEAEDSGEAEEQLGDIEEEQTFELDYDKLAESIAARIDLSAVPEETANLVAERLGENVAADNGDGEARKVELNYDKLAEAIAAKSGISEVPEETANLVAERILNGDELRDIIKEERRIELNYDKLAEAVASKIYVGGVSEDGGVNEEQAEEQVEEQTEESVTLTEETLAQIVDEISKRVCEFLPTEYDIVVDDEGCEAIANAIGEKLPKAEPVQAEPEEKETEEAEEEEYDIVIDDDGVNRISDGVAEKIAAVTESRIAETNEKLSAFEQAADGRFDKIEADVSEIKDLIKSGAVIAAAEELAAADAAAVDEPEDEDGESGLVTVSDVIGDAEEAEQTAEAEEVEEAEEAEVAEGVVEFIEQPETDVVIEEIMGDIDEQPVEGEVMPDGLEVTSSSVDFANMMKYNRSFIARIIQGSDEVKTYYGQTKTALLSYKKVNSSVAWGAERFNKGRETIAKFKIRGKTLCLYLALDPKEYPVSVYHQVDVSDNKSMATTPMMVKIKSPRGVKKAIRLIDDMLTKRGAVKQNVVERDYVAMYPYETIEELIEDGLVKDVSKNK